VHCTGTIWLPVHTELCTAVARSIYTAVVLLGYIRTRTGTYVPYEQGLLTACPTACPTSPC
jgi:hypothetical protein